MNRRYSKRFEPWFWLLPFVVLSMLFCFIPLAKTFFSSFFIVNNMGELLEFVGLENFLLLMKDEIFLKSILNTLKFTAITVPIVLFLGFWISLFSIKVKRLSFLHEFVLSIPCAISLPVAAMIFQTLLMPRVGFISKLLGVDFDWLYNPDYSIFALAIIQIWSSTAFAYVFYRNSFLKINSELIESAEMDGASFFQLVHFVYFPQSLKTTFYLVFANLSTSMLMMSLSNVLTNGGPQYSTITVAQYIYSEFINSGNMTVANAATIFYLIVFSPLIISFVVLLRKWRTESL